MIQWLRLCAFTAEGVGSIPGQATEIPQAASAAKKERKKKKRESERKKTNLQLPKGEGEG